ncbi:MAG TPA: hypothetical protein VE978_12500 [Chitinophagales bacterium]|nr:hypothetical protein [Chitinophagales bacterium]
MSSDSLALLSGTRTLSGNIKNGFLTLLNVYTGVTTFFTSSSGTKCFYKFVTNPNKSSAYIKWRKYVAVLNSKQQSKINHL